MKTIEVHSKIRHAKSDIKSLIEHGHNLNKVYSLLQKRGIKYEKEIINIGLACNEKDVQAKSAFLAEDTADNIIHLHLYTHKAKVNNCAYVYFILRGVRLTLIDK